MIVIVVKASVFFVCIPEIAGLVLLVHHFKSFYIMFNMFIHFHGSLYETRHIGHTPGEESDFRRTESEAGRGARVAGRGSGLRVLGD